MKLTRKYYYMDLQHGNLVTPGKLLCAARPGYFCAGHRLSDDALASRSTSNGCAPQDS